jgi:polyisoprenyl-phosphate glycosyltransferase
MHAEDEPQISLVVPMYEDASCLDALYDRVTPVMEGLGRSYEFVFVNDGSHDDTLDRLRGLVERDPRVRVVDLSRNYGKEVALAAGIRAATGRAIIPLDADLQDPPEVIRDLVSKWDEGFDEVYAVRRSRQGETMLKKATASIFYRVMNLVSDVEIPRDAGDFRLISRQVADALNEITESERYNKGLFAWVGFRQTSVLYDREPRTSGTPKQNYFRLWRLALDGITSFSRLPLQIATYSGLLVALGAVIYAIRTIANALLGHVNVPGYSSLMTVVLFLGGVQLFTIGIMGAYVGRIYVESKRRPLYFVRETFGFQNEPRLDASADADRGGS